MRILLGALLLVALFLAATTWQRRFTAAARTDLEIARGKTDRIDGGERGGETGGETPPEGWSVVTVGRPSGGERFGNPAPAPAPATPPASRPASSSPAAPAVVPGAPRAAPASAAPTSTSEWIVEPGQSLSRICAARYGTARAEVVEAVARHNGLADPGLVREGQRLSLPPIESLLRRN